MNKLRLPLLAAIGMLAGTVCVAREFRSPLAILDGPIGYPMNDRQEKDWHIDGWGGAYTRTSSRSYRNGTDKASLAKLFFGQECFKVSDILANQGVGAFNNDNPFIFLQTLHPEIRYDEQGVALGLYIYRKLSNRLRCGIRTTVPFRRIAVQPTGCGMEGTGAQLGDVRLIDLESINGSPVQQRFAYRFDFLSVLGDKDYPQATIEPLVKFADPTKNNHITIVQQDVTQPSADASIAPAPGVNVRRSVTGTPPTLPYAATSATVQASGFVAPDGSSPADQGRAKFSPAANYQTGGFATPAVLRQYFLVETDENNGSVSSPEWDTIHNRVESIVEGISSSSALAFLQQHCYCFGGQTTTGVGDTDTDLFLEWDPNDWSYLTGILGFRWPSGIQVHNFQQVYQVPTGNNGHNEIKLGLSAGLAAFDWLAFRLDGSYSFVLKHCENLLGSFKNSCVKNLGPCSKAQISWGYFRGRFDVALMHPREANLGLDIAYELYVKGHDHIQFTQKSANDLLGACGLLDSCAAERISHQVGHIIRGEIFKRHGPCQFFAGASHVFAGKNMPVESDVYLGLNLEF